MPSDRMKAVQCGSGRLAASADGLSNNTVSSIFQDMGGASRFDGRTFQTIDSRDGLPNDNVTSVYMDSS